MATRLLCLNQKLQNHRRYNLRLIATCLRNISSQDQNSNEYSDHHPQNQNPNSIAAESAFKWLNIRAGIFGPDDKRLPLPGDVGMKDYFEQINEAAMSNAAEEYEDNVECFNGFVTSQEYQMESVQQAHIKQKEMCDSQTDELSVGSMFECRIQNCPALLAKDFQELFPSRSFHEKSLKVVTLCCKTNNDMSSWSEAVELEREEIEKHFVGAAEAVCESLHSHGFWADFIDPHSGRPHAHPFTSATFFETDERYRQLGFVVEDLGCCKVISHRVFGTKVFVGALFTTAPVDLLEEALAPINILGN